MWRRHMLLPCERWHGGCPARAKHRSSTNRLIMHNISIKPDQFLRENEAHWPIYIFASEDNKGRRALGTGKYTENNNMQQSLPMLKDHRAASASHIFGRDIILAMTPHNWAGEANGSISNVEAMSSLEAMTAAWSSGHHVIFKSGNKKLHPEARR